MAPMTAVDSAWALRQTVVGVDQPVPVVDGRMLPYVNLDNAASTPAFHEVWRAVEDFLPYYSGVHRGTGYLSRMSTAAFEEARAMVGRFVGADPERDVVVFGKNTTEAVNRLARSLRLAPDAVILTTLLEHHSNDLPWRDRAGAGPGVRVVRVRAARDGSLDEDHLDRLLATHAGHVALLAVSGASNVTGLVPPIHRLAARVHAAGGAILVDAAQLAGHRRIDMRPHDDPGHLDFVALSAHKAYAPFGTGALVGRRDAFAGHPDHVGGGTVRAVSATDVAWAELPDREEAGSPNVVGAVALAAATQALSRIGLDAIAAHEAALTGYAVDRLRRVPGVTVHGPAATAAPPDRVGVVPFTVAGFDHALVAAVLGYEHAVGVRSGCFCAQPYVRRLLGVSESDADLHVALARGGPVEAPGLVRLSFGCYSDPADVDRAVAAVIDLVADGPGPVRARYRCDADGAYAPVGYVEPSLFCLDCVPPLTPAPA
jgi:selenocysteine lyase/cysteine desulfurase